MNENVLELKLDQDDEEGEDADQGQSDKNSEDGNSPSRRSGGQSGQNGLLNQSGSSHSDEELVKI